MRKEKVGREKENSREGEWKRKRAERKRDKEVRKGNGTGNVK